MEVQEQAQEQGSQAGDHGQSIVTITINNTGFSIHRGRQSVGEIKETGGIPKADVLDQIVEGKLVELDDNGAVTIKGGEQFISHPRDSASS